MKKTILFSMAIAAVSLFGSCANDVEMNYPPTHELSNLPIVEGIHDGVKAPLYWSVYEYCLLENAKGVNNCCAATSTAAWCCDDDGSGFSAGDVADGLIGFVRMIRMRHHLDGRRTPAHRRRPLALARHHRRVDRRARGRRRARRGHLLGVEEDLPRQAAPSRRGVRLHAGHIRRGDGTPFPPPRPLHEAEHAAIPVRHSRRAGR